MVMRLSRDGCLPLLTPEAVQFHRDFSLGLTPLTLLGSGQTNKLRRVLNSVL